VQRVAVLPALHQHVGSAQLWDHRGRAQAGHAYTSLKRLLAPGLGLVVELPCEILGERPAIGVEVESPLARGPDARHQTQQRQLGADVFGDARIAHLDRDAPAVA
jgi:hypothetical protein